MHYTWCALNINTIQRLSAAVHIVSSRYNRCLRELQRVNGDTGTSSES